MMSPLCRYEQGNYIEWMAQYDEILGPSFPVFAAYAGLCARARACVMACAMPCCVLPNEGGDGCARRFAFKTGCMLG